MDIQQALNILNEVASKVQTDRQNHAIYIQAIEVLQNLINQFLEQEKDKKKE